MIESLSITVKGIVQGVYYRQKTKDNALRSGITGEIKNMPDGDVHILATGTTEQLEEFIKWCNKGPETAVVSRVIVEKIPVKNFTSFRIVR
ncbi:MAG: acylphosphatase [Chitinophagaceae bacterium]